jgi:hypothetical protein
MLTVGNDAARVERVLEEGSQGDQLGIQGRHRSRTVFYLATTAPYPGPPPTGPVDHSYATAELLPRLLWERAHTSRSPYLAGRAADAPFYGPAPSPRC